LAHDQSRLAAAAARAWRSGGADVTTGAPWACGLLRGDIARGGRMGRTVQPQLTAATTTTTQLTAECRHACGSSAATSTCPSGGGEERDTEPDGLAVLSGIDRHGGACDANGFACCFKGPPLEQRTTAQTNESLCCVGGVHGVRRSDSRRRPACEGWANDGIPMRAFAAGGAASWCVKQCMHGPSRSRSRKDGSREAAQRSAPTELTCCHLPLQSCCLPLHTPSAGHSTE
jgi:hypothetical protein